MKAAAHNLGHTVDEHTKDLSKMIWDGK